MSELAQAGVGTAHLSSELDDDGPYTVHGVALGAGDVTLGSSGTKKKWPGEELRDAAKTLEGQPLVRDHKNNTEGTIGTVTKATYRDGVGVLYEAEIAPHYEEMAKDVASGILEVSARAYHAPTDELEEDDSTGALVVSDVKFDNLSVVSNGASPSNTVEIGGIDIEGAATMAQGPDGSSVAVMEEGAPRLGAAELESEFNTQDSETSDSEEELGHIYEIGELVEWGDEKIGSVTGVFVEDGVHKYNVRVFEKSENGVKPTDQTETVISHNVMKAPHVPTSDMSVKSDEYAESVPDDLDNDELAEINDMEINGTVMWDGQMGVISGFVQEDGEVMVQIDVIENDDGEFQKTGDSVTKPMTDVENMEDMEQNETEPDTEELQDISVHEPEFSGSVDQEWTKPDMSEFTDAESWDDLSEDEQSDIADHFLISKSGFPPETFGDLGLPVVETDGQLNLNALTNAKARAGQVSGLSGDTLDEVESMIDSLANENFEDASFGEDDDAEEEENEQGDDRSVAVAALNQDDDARGGSTGQSTGGVAALKYDNTLDTTMTSINYEDASEDAIEEMNDPVVIEQDDVEDLRSKAERAEELDGRLDDVNSTLDELAEHREVLEDVDEDKLDELREYDDAVVLTDDEYDELQGLVDDVGGIFADELADYSPFDADELQERWTPMELKAKVDDHEEAGIGELEQGDDPEPEGGSASKEELESGDGGDDGSDVSEEDAREAVARDLESEDLHRQAEKVRSGEIGLEEMGIELE